MSAAIAAFMPVFYVMLSEMGYSNSAIGWYYAVFWFLSTVFEVPFGIFTDFHGTKRTMLAAIMLKILGFILLLVPVRNMVSIVIVGILTGVGEAGISGCLPSWFVNENNQRDKREDVTKIFAKTNAICCIVSLIVGFCSGQILYIKNIYFPIYLSLVLFAAAVLFFVVFPKDTVQNQGDKGSGTSRMAIKWKEKKETKNIRSIFLQNRSMILLFIGLSFTDVLNCAPGNQWSKVFEDLNIFGYIWIGFNGATILGGYILSRAKNIVLTEKKSDLLYLVEISLLFLAYLLRMKPVMALIMFLVYVFFYQIHIILYGSYLHTNVINDDASRNMQISVFNMTNSLMCTAALVVIGYMGDGVDLMLVWVIMAAVSGMGYFMFKNKIWKYKKEIQL